MAGIGVQDHRNHCSGSRNPRSRSRNRCSRWIGISVQDGPEYAIPQNIPLELRKHGQHPGQRPPARGRQVERFAQGHETDIEGGQLLERVHHVGQGPPPAIQSPDPDAIDLSPAGRRDERLPLGASRGSGSDVLNPDGDGPIPLRGIVPHCRELQWQRLLVVGGHAPPSPGTAWPTKSATHDRPREAGSWSGLGGASATPGTGKRQA